MVEISNSEKKTKTPRRFFELDALRGIAVLAVVFVHYTVGYDYHFHLKQDGKFYLNYGNFAVHLFFVISGFVIFMTLDKTKRKADFLVSRFSRLFPAYWASVIITALFVKIFSIPTLGNYTFKEVAINMTMLEAFFKVRFVDQVYWTLKVELIFYFLMFTLFSAKYLSKINIFCVFWLALSLISTFLNIPFKRYLDIVFILEFAPLFIAGINFYKLTKEQSKLWNHVLIISSFIVESFKLYRFDEIDYHYNPVIGILIVFGIYIVFYLFVYNYLSILKNKVLIFFGTISYSLYLLHNVIGYAIIYQLRRFSESQWLYVTVPLLITVGMATCLNYYLEKPAMELMRGWYKNYKDRKYA